jgi:predicted lipoprotein with Yx(FWY)xxD motif
MKMHLVKARALYSLVAAAALAACASAPSAAGPAKVADGVLVGSNGMTLYTFDKDTAGSGKSVCNGQCATNWPPLMAKDGDAASGDWSIVTRDDGAKQWAMKGKPLYYFIKDTKAGDKTGEGVMQAWHAAKP